jgi:prepilin-type N-terminal cleavage/methylation domain-containing protein
MKTKKNKKGFTLAELLIVVAIIAVLVAIAIPVFTSQLEKSREATDIANVRSAYAEVVTNYLTDNDSTTKITVKAQQTVPGWTDDNSGTIEYFSNNATYSFSYEAQTTQYVVGITIDSNTGDATPSITAS